VPAAVDDAIRRALRLPGYTPAWRRREYQQRSAALLYQPVLRAVGATAGELLSRCAEGQGTAHEPGDADPAGLRTSSPRRHHGPGRRLPSAQDARPRLRAAGPARDLRD